MANTKNLATVPSVDSSNSANLLAEVNGEIVRLPYSLMDERLVLKTEFSEYKISNDAELAQQKSDLNDLSNMKSGAIVQTASGESIVTNDSSNDPLRGLRVFGKTEQFTTTGKNLLEVVAKNQTYTGITFTVNGDGSVTANGTATTDTYFEIAVKSDNVYDNSYILSGCPNGGSDTTYKLLAQYYDEEDVWVANSGDLGNGTTLNGQFVKIAIQIVIKSGYTANNVTFYPMIRLASITDDTYEPYTGGIPSPSPQYPQELVSVGADGDVEVGLYGGNLLNNTATSQAINGVTFTVNDDKSVTVNGTATEKTFLKVMSGTMPSGTYILSAGIYVDYNTRMQVIDTKDNSIVYAMTADVSERVFTLNSDTNVTVQVRVGSGYTANNIVFKPMIRLASITDDTYEPYTKQTLTAITPNGLPGIKLGTVIPDVIANSAIHMSGVYWNEDDDQYYIADTVDFERGVYVKRIEKVDASWKISNISTASTGQRLLVIATGILQKTHCPVVCSHVSQKRASSYNVVGEYISTDEVVGYDRVAIRFNEERFATNEEVNAWVDNEKLEVYYILETPIETPLSEEELTAYRALHANYPVTTVLNDSGANVEVKYNADTKNYIDNKFAEMTNAILSMGGNV